MPETTTLRRAGYLAALFGLAQDDNPHNAERETLAWHLWDEGYQDCCRVEDREAA